jgi:hypothetical protein
MTSSTSQLDIRACLLLNDIKSTWLKLNHDSGQDVHVIHNVMHPQARYMNACYTAPKVGCDHKPDDCCNAHIKAVGRSRNVMEITLHWTRSIAMTGSRTKRFSGAFWPSTK